MRAALDLRTPDPDHIEICLAGDWLVEEERPDDVALTRALSEASKNARISFDAAELGRWDSGLLATLVAVQKMADARGLTLDTSALPDGAERLLKLAFAVPEREGARRKKKEHPFLSIIGQQVLDAWTATKALLTFTGELVLALGRFVTGRATYLRANLWQYVQEAGVEALGIVALISLLIGMIFAFVGVMQLKNFGAGIYTADLVAIAMVREMAPIMTAIIMAGRTGAAYAAEIGTMKVNEEIDALTTLGLDPHDFLVVPRVLSLIVMMPLLTMYSSLLGVVGGLIVGLSMLDVSFVQYVTQTINAVDLSSLFGGLFKSVVYGILVAIAGCQQGMACGNSAMAVGQSTTRAVVMGIVLIVVSASVLTVVYINLGI